jgi:hypothetical protein
VKTPGAPKNAGNAENKNENSKRRTLRAQALIPHRSVLLGAFGVPGVSSRGLAIFILAINH